MIYNMYMISYMALKTDIMLHQLCNNQQMEQFLNVTL